ncbi:von Willebrand factor A domain-containing protein 2-like [Rhinoraja longicauda]
MLPYPTQQMDFQIMDNSVNNGSQGSGLQQLMADKETIEKILSSGKLIQCSSSIDVLLLMDGSYSIGKGSFERSKHFAAKLCDILDINPDRVRIGVIQFSSKPEMEFGLETYPTRKEAKEAIKKITFRGGSTEIGKAVKSALDKGFRGGREDALKIIVILSDGKSQDDATMPLMLARDSGVTIFAVGIRHPAWNELDTLANHPSDKHVFYAGHYDDAVNGLYTALTQAAVCSDVHPACRVVSHFCQRTTVNTEKKYLGNHLCWKSKRIGAKQHGKPFATFCPFYTWKRTYSRVQRRCFRTLCPGFTGIIDCSVDILFLVDGSWRVGPKGFLQAKAFVKRLLQIVTPSSAGVQVGFIQYSDKANVEIGRGPHSNIGDLLKLIDNIPFRGGKTLTGKALQYIVESGFMINGESGADVPQFLVLLTSSESLDSVTVPAQYAKGREIFVLPVSGKHAVNQSNHVAGDDQLGLTYSEPQELYIRILELSMKKCGRSSSCFSTSLDLVFALDASGDIGRGNFRQIKGFVRNAVSRFVIDRDRTQVAVVIFSNRPRTLFNLDSLDSEGKIKRAVSSGPFLGGQAHTGKALQHVLKDTLSTGKGARPGTQKVIVVIANGRSADDVAAAAAEDLRRAGTTIIALGLDDDQGTSMLRIAGSHEFTVPVHSYEDLKYYENTLGHSADSILHYQSLLSWQIGIGSIFELCVNN